MARATLTINGMSLFRLREGKVIEDTTDVDLRCVLQQISPPQARPGIVAW